MAESQDKPAESFRVVDRRYKTIVDEGKPLEEASKPAPAAPQARPVTPSAKSDPVSVVQSVARGEPRPAPPPAAAPGAAPGPKRSPEVTFEGFVRSLYTQIMIQLGLVENPLSAEMEPDIEGAKQTIDILDLMKEKTKGNLDKREDQVLTEALTASRLAYVESTKRRR